MATGTLDKKKSFTEIHKNGSIKTTFLPGGKVREVIKHNGKRTVRIV